MSKTFPSKTDISNLWYMYCKELKQLEIEQDTVNEICTELSVYLSLKSSCVILEAQNQLNDKIKYISDKLDIHEWEFNTELQ